MGLNNTERAIHRVRCRECGTTADLRQTNSKPMRDRQGCQTPYDVHDWVPDVDDELLLGEDAWTWAVGKVVVQG